MNRRVDIALFGVQAYLAYLIVQILFFPSRHQGSNPLVILMIYLSTVPGVIIGLVKYRLWRNRLFWMLLTISALAFAILVGSQEWTRLNGMIDPVEVGLVLIIATLLAPVFTIPLWQLIMAVSRGARTLKG